MWDVQPQELKKRNDLESWCLWQASKRKKKKNRKKKSRIFGTNNCSKIRTYTTLSYEGNVENYSIKNGRDQIGPGESYIFVYRVIKTIMLLFLPVFWFNGKIFFVVLQSACPSRKRRGKTPQQICYVNYCEWAFIIMKF